MRASRAPERMVVYSPASSSVRTFGETLRQARLDKGVSLAEAEQDTRIRQKYLEALESEDWSAVPPPVYTRGFVRTYAEYLGLNPRAMVDLYQPGPRREPQPTIRSAVPKVAIPRDLPLRPIAYVFAAIAFIAVVAYLWTALQRAAADLRQQEDVPTIRQATATLPRGVPTPLPVAIASPSPSPSPTPVATPVPTVDPTSTAVPDGILIEFRTTAQAYVEASVDGRQVLAEQVPRGTTRTLPLGRDVVIMRVSNASVVEVRLNGQPQEKAAGAGPVEYTWRR